MLNIEKYEEELRPFGTCFAITKDGKIKNCKGFRCGACAFHDVPDSNCNESRFEWLMKEYKEPILTDKEKTYLKNVIEPRRDEITIITKNRYCANTESEFTTIEVYVKNPWVDINKNDRTCPNYKLLDLITTEDMPFNGMKLFEYYTLKDLGL